MKIVSIEHKKGSNTREHIEWDNYVVYGVTGKESKERCDYTKINWEEITGDNIVEIYSFKAAYMNQIVSDLKLKGIEDLKGRSVRRIMFDNYKKPCFMILE